MSVIVATYNRPDALDLVVRSLMGQTVPPLEILIADDGSADDTPARIAALAQGSPVPVRHVRQDDEGFRLARIRNLAAQQARGDYLIFLDGDCITLPRWVEKHVQWAEPGWFTVGRRCFLYETPTRAILTWSWRINAWPRAILFAFAVFGGATRPFQLIPLNFAEARRKNRPTEPNKAQTCNFGVWRSDFLALGGFEEGYADYGLEDTDFVIRLFRYGARRITLEHAEPVLHLWHPRRPIGAANRARLDRLKASDRVRAERSVLLADVGAPDAEPVV